MPKVRALLFAGVGLFAGVVSLVGYDEAQAQRPTPSAGLLAAVGESGVLSGAPYRIDVPAGWRGGLVVLFHGYQVSGDKREEPYPALQGTELFLARGYAVLQSGYSRQGWAVAEARAETRALRTAFERRFGRPNHTYAVGFSMGGHIALATVEQEPHQYDGALSLCGANMPASSLLNKAVGDLAAAQALFPNTIPNLDAAASPAMLDDKALRQAIAKDPDAAARLAAFTGYRVANLPDTLWLLYTVVREMRTRAGGFPGDNTKMIYRGFADDSALNSRVSRYAVSKAAANYVRATSSLTGRLRDPVVILDNAYDDVVSVGTQSTYPTLVRRSGRENRLTVLPPVGEGHCQFSAEQMGRAFDTLREQVEAPPQRDNKIGRVK